MEDDRKPLFSDETIRFNMQQEQNDTRHRELLGIQKKQIKIFEQQNKFTKILAIGTIILAITTFLQFFSLNELFTETILKNDLTSMLVYVFGLFGSIILVFAFIYLVLIIWFDI